MKAIHKYFVHMFGSTINMVNVHFSNNIVDIVFGLFRDVSVVESKANTLRPISFKLGENVSAIFSCPLKGKGNHILVSDLNYPLVELLLSHQGS